MDHTVLRDRDFVADIESGGTTSEEEGNRDAYLGFRQPRNLLDRVWGGLVSIEASIKDEDGVSSRAGSSSANIAAENVKSLMGDRALGEEEKVALLENITEKKKRKHSNSKKPPKPPRPPRGPSLDAADQKLIREISELAMLKRARNERMKAQKKMKATKTTSSGGSICAMVVTVMFCLIIIFQGLISRGNSHAKFLGSPQPAEVPSGGWISVHYYKDVPASSTDGPGFGSPNLAQQAFG
ncbi:hypothetical protein Syun_028643 [Stephania yunnanensis]|uniref:Transmembrane protein n=1 Tax=Stephania yunnanensis TaxID=152371 RepID=A0AAP0HGN4_9MAGN